MEKHIILHAFYTVTIEVQHKISVMISTSRVSAMSKRIVWEIIANQSSREPTQVMTVDKALFMYKGVDRDAFKPDQCAAFHLRKVPINTGGVKGILGANKTEVSKGDKKISIRRDRNRP